MISDSVRNRPQLTRDFCSACGEKPIKECPTQGRGVGGALLDGMEFTLE